MREATPVIEVRDLYNTFGKQVVHAGVSFIVKPSEIFAIVGGSGTGKTTLLRTCLMLQRPTRGSVSVLGVDVLRCRGAEAQALRGRWGVLFQSGALFSSLSVLDNITFALIELNGMPSFRAEAIARLKLSLVGLSKETADKQPAELSGGMKKRVALARALALDPELIFLDEPTSGLDPKSAYELDRLILELRAHLGVTFVIITHDVQTLWRVPDRICFLGESRVLACSPMQELLANKHPLIVEYFEATGGYRVQKQEGSAS
ncbi:MAG: ABC transporter ATP-binding protein [Gammaproteobacteria bacterium RIFCSPHIGHO2_12_FULL_45_9]|nr:MAG: ABC transporter ATP-binding protein [Gammaproteobacteria bacterium RIFCSPHIGHO2_12_FULL_45_9]